MSEKVCTNRCGACFFLGRSTGTCDYIFIMGIRRPCPPGKDCTEYLLRKEGEQILRKPKWDTEAGRQMWLDGKTDTQIAEALGTTARAVNLYKYRKWIPETPTPSVSNKHSGELPPLKGSTTAGERKRKVPKEETLAEIEQLEQAYGDKLSSTAEAAPLANTSETAKEEYEGSDKEIPLVETENREEEKMNNYISIGNQKIGLTEEQVEKIVAAYNVSRVKLSDIPEGDTFKIGEYEFVVLEQKEDTAAVILKDLLHESTKFGDNNNYDGSRVDQQCQDFAQKLAEIIGWDNIVLHKVDLTSNDGLKDYGQVERAASLLTADQYRRYVQILDKEKLDEWWWLATPWSTPFHESENYVLCVSPSGGIRYFYYFYISGDNGVRPFCILKSNIFVSK